MGVAGGGGDGGRLDYSARGITFVIIFTHNLVQ